MSGLTHFDAKGDAHMVDVSEKAVTTREALAVSTITMSDEAFAAVKAGDAKKGDVLGVARIAAIQAAKRTSELIPLCHPLMLTKVSVEFALSDAENSVETQVLVKTAGQTGVEMEALTAASVASLTIYDMLKAVDKSMTITSTRLLEKRGGKSGEFKAET